MPAALVVCKVSAYISCYAYVAVGIGAVGCKSNVYGEICLGYFEVFFCGHANRGIGREYHDACMAFAQAYLIFGAYHACAFFAAYLCFFYEECLAFGGVHCGAYGGYHYALACGYIGCATDYL